MTPALEVVDLVKHYRAGTGITGGGAVVHAVDGVSFTLGQGETLGLVDESGSGKSTIAKCILRLTDPTAGTIRLRGTDITHLSRRALRPLRRELHIVFQDPFSSLNPRMTCGTIVAEPLRLQASRAGGTSTVASRRCSTRWACTPSSVTATRASSRGASASASASPAR